MLLSLLSSLSSLILLSLDIVVFVNDVAVVLKIDVEKIILPEIFQKIKYLVIQCGTKLLETLNIGTYDSEKLQKMLLVCKKYNLIAKEHNGDWISYDIVKEKENYGLTCINIAPEFGEIESSVIINHFKQNPKDLDDFFSICYESNTWKKWVFKITFL